MSATWTSHLGEFERRNSEGQRAGLLAAATVYSQAMKKALSRGYTSGEFVSGKSAEAVTISDPFQLGRDWGIRVGTNLVSNVAWEFGHFNLFLKRWVRVERWRPTIIDTRAEMGRVFAESYIRTVESG